MILNIHTKTGHHFSYFYETGHKVSYIIKSIERSIMMQDKELLKREHESVRNSVGFFDFAHQILEVTGKDTADFLDKMCVNEISDLKAGSAVYTTILNENAEVLDDVIIFYHGENKFWVSTLFIKELIQWFEKHKENMDVSMKDVTENTSLYSIQGPNSRKLLNDILNEDINDLKYFHFMDNKIGDIPLKVSRTGFTGELGFEFFFDPKYTDQIVNELMEKGKKYDIAHIITDVTLNSLPTEKGYIKSNDFKGANPIELGLEWSVDCEKDFIGKEALCRIKDEGASRKLMGFTVDSDDTVSQGDIIMVDDKEIGNVTNYTYGFTLGKNIGYAMLDAEYAQPNKSIKIKSSGKMIDATISDRVFYDPKNEKIRA